MSGLAAESWASPPVILSGIAAIAAIASAIIAWLVFRHQRAEADDLPRIKIDVRTMNDQPGWFAFEIHATNYSERYWKADRVELRSKGLSVAARRDVQKRDGKGGVTLDLESAGTANFAALGTTLAPYGIQQQFGGQYIRTLSLLIRADQPAPSKVKLKLFFVTMDAIEKRRAIEIVRALPPHPDAPS